MGPNGQCGGDERSAAVDEGHRAERGRTVSKRYRVGWPPGPRGYGRSLRHGLPIGGGGRRGGDPGRRRRRGWIVDGLVHGRRGAGGERGAAVIGGGEGMNSGGQRRDTQRGAAV